MNKNEREQWERFTIRANELGLSIEETWRLRRDAIRLSRWNLNECNGDIERDDNGKTFRNYNHNGPGPIKRYPTRDMETPAKNRIKAILTAKGLRPYFQGDPRGEPVYILKQDQSEDNYTNGTAIPTPYM